MPLAQRRALFAERHNTRRFVSSSSEPPYAGTTQRGLFKSTNGAPCSGTR